MKAILLAAGVGSRISAEIDQKPKSTLLVNGQPLISHTVELLLKNNIDVTIVVGYKHKMIEAVLKDFPVKFYYNPFYAVTNSIGSLWMAKEELSNEDIIIANADVFYSQDILDLIFHSKFDNFLLEDVSRALTGDYFFKSNNGILEKYGKELRADERNSEYVGIAVLRSEWVKKFYDKLCSMIEEGKYNLWWENVLYSFTESDTVHTVDVNGLFWSEVDTIEDYQRVLDHFKK